MLRIVVAALAFAFCGSLAEAAECANPVNQAEITECAGQAAAKADADLNEAYGKLIALLGAGDQVLLVEAQRAWIAFRDAECVFRTKSYDDGTIYATLLANCLAELGAARAEQLISQINCGEADLCPPHVAAATAAPTADNNGSCRITAGMKRAQLYASQCSAVKPDNANCNFETPCGVMIDDIKTWCAAAGAGAPGFCATYLGEEKP